MTAKKKKTEKTLLKYDAEMARAILDVRNDESTMQNARNNVKMEPHQYPCVSFGVNTIYCADGRTCSGNCTLFKMLGASVDQVIAWAETIHPVKEIAEIPSFSDCAKWRLA